MPVPGLSSQPLDVLSEANAADWVMARGRYILGLFFILVQCIVWIVGAVLAQYLYEAQAFSSSFLLTFLGMSLLSLLLPLRLVTNQVGITRAAELSCSDSFDAQLQAATHCSDYVQMARTQTEQLVNQSTVLTEELSAQSPVHPATTTTTTTRTTNNKDWDHRKHFFAAVLVAPAMFAADWAFNAALVHTSVASATVLVSTQSVFVLLLAVLCKLETFSWLKLSGVLLTVLGTALTATHDADSSDDPNTTALWGDALAVVAAMAYATYTILVRIVCPQDEHLYSMQLLLGYVGLICLVLLIPVALYLWISVVHVTAIVLLVVVTKGLLDFCITDYCLFRAIVLTNATIATVGLGLTIPMAFATDQLMGKVDHITISGIMGALAVTVGFVVVNVANPDVLEARASEPLLDAMKGHGTGGSKVIPFDATNQSNKEVAYTGSNSTEGSQNNEIGVFI